MKGQRLLEQVGVEEGSSLSFSALILSTYLASGRKQTNSRIETRGVSGLELLFLKLLQNMYIFNLGPLELSNFNV